MAGNSHGRRGASRGQPASPVRRLAAFLLDALAAGVIGAPLTAFLALLAPGLSEAAFDLLSRVIGLTVFVIYSIIITISRGYTLGKYLLRLRIVQAGTRVPATEPQVTARSAVLGLELAVFALVLPALQVPSVVVFAALAVLVAPVLLRPDRRAFHDLAAGTAVIVPPVTEAGP